MEYRWSNAFASANNSAPAFGEVDDGIIAACCQNGLGTAKGTLAGIAAAEMADASIPHRAGKDRGFAYANQPRKTPPAACMVRR